MDNKGYIININDITQHKTYSISITSETRVRDLKKMIYNKYNIRESDQVLIYNNCEMKNDNSILSKDYDIERGSIIRLDRLISLDDNVWENAYSIPFAFVPNSYY